MSWTQNRHPRDTNSTKTPVQSPLHQYQQPQLHPIPLIADPVANTFNVNAQWNNYNQAVQQPAQISEVTAFAQEPNTTSNNSASWPQQHYDYANKGITSGVNAVQPVNYFASQQQTVDNFLQQPLIPPHAAYLQSVPPLLQALPLSQGQNSNKLVSGNVVKSQQPAELQPTQKNVLSKPDQYNNNNNKNNNNRQGGSTDWDDWNDWNDNNTLATVNADQPSLQNPQQHFMEDSFNTELSDNWQFGNNSVGLTNLSKNNHNQLTNESATMANVRSNNGKSENKLVSPMLSGAPTLSNESSSNFVPNLHQVHLNSVNFMSITANAPNLSVSHEVISSLPETTGSENISGEYLLQTKPVAKPPGQFSNPTTAEKIASTPPQLSQHLLPTLSHASTSAGNPFKRTVTSHQHRSLSGNHSIQQQTNVMPFFVSPPPPPLDFANPTDNQEILSAENLEVIDQQPGIKNNDVIPNKDRNQYLQTSHLSEEGLCRNSETVSVQELNSELDTFPPPGLSRLVLGQLESTQNPPDGLDRMIPGTELDSDLNLVRQADGQDTVPILRSAFSVADNRNNVASSNIDFTSDRNLYLVPGDSGVNEPQQLRVVTGLENNSHGVPSMVMPSSPIMVDTVQTEQREVELDGENLEDVPLTIVSVEQQHRQQQQHDHQYQYQQQQEHHQQQNIHQTINLPLNQQHNTSDQLELLLSSREEPIEGANTMDNPSLLKQNASIPNKPVVSLESNPSKDLSNLSTEIDESDQEQFKRHSNYFAKSTRLGDDKKKRPLTTPDEQRRDRRYDSEESDYSSERENRRYRENSVKDDRNKDRDSKERKRPEKYDTDRVKSDLRTKDRYRDEKDRYDRNSDYRGSVRRDKYEKDRSSRYGGGSKYDTDLKYETESSTKNERRIGPDRERDRDRDRERDRKRDDESDRYNDQRRDNEWDRRHNRKVRRDGRDEREKDRDRDRGRGYRDRNYPDDRENRRSIRDKKNSDYEDAYRKTSSRNARESDLERDRKDSRFSSSQMYGSGYQSNSYGYDPYTLYQHQQYYEHLRRTNPQAYAEWYRKYYGQMQQDSLTTDGRESVHSGRSSANNEKNRYSVQQHHHHQYIAHQIAQSNLSMNLNSTMIDQQQYVGSGVVRGSYGLGHGQSTGNLSQIGQIPGGYYGDTSGRSYYARSEYSETRTDNMSLNLIDGNGINASSIQESARLTPCKFNNSHSVVSLTAGLLISVKPKYSANGTANIVKMLKFAPNDSTRRLFQSFPGPLIRGLTHKRTVIEFCEEQIRLGPSSTVLRSRQNSMNSLSSSVSQANKASYCLMWNLLILLLHQNGMIVGTDIAELLMKNISAYPYEATNSALGSKCAGSRRESVQSNEFTEKLAAAGSDIEIESTSAVDSNKTNRSELEEHDVMIGSTTLLTEQTITEKFRNYLLYGNVNEALEWATENNLWGHALFLASKVDRRSHANVMMKFANKLSLNDPLQTLYQLMSGRMPSSVTSIQDEKWGDWRTHLAMILSNTSQKPELDQKSITTLGDSLYNRGDLFGAHFCYLMAQVGFGNYSDASTETTTLLTKSSNAVRLVLLGSSHQKQFKEFATNEAIMMTEIYEYACSLNDDKFSIVQFQPYKYLMATRMLDYGYHLKCLMYMEQIALHIQRDPTKFEPSFIEKIFKMADRLKYYDPILEKHVDDQEHLDNSNSTVPDQKWLQNLYGITQEYAGNLNLKLNQQTQHKSTLIEDPNQISEINNEFSEINRQFNELNLQYTNYTPSQSLGSVQQTLPEISTDNQYISPQPAVTQVVQSYNSENYYQQNDVSNKTHQQMATTYSEPSSNNYLQPAYIQQQNLYQYGNPNQETLQKSTYEYMASDQQWQQPMPFNNETQKQQISLPNSKIGYDDNSGKDSTASGTGGDSKKSQTLMKKSEQKQQSGKVDANTKLGVGGGNNEAGWFGGIWNKLSLKPKNQMILPDDKNPSIVWDQENKCWVNTEGGDEAENSFKPPPKMSDIMPHPKTNYNEVPQQVLQFASNPQPEQSNSAPLPGMIPTNNPNQNYSASMATGHNIPPTVLGGEITKTPSLQSNKFKMQRNRTLKNSYVDVFNPPGAQPSKQTETVLAPIMTTAAVPQGGFFIPSAPDTNSSQNQYQQQDSEVPQFYNPNQYGGYQK